jgi:hypothetical protein
MRRSWKMPAGSCEQRSAELTKEVLQLFSGRKVEQTAGLVYGALREAGQGDGLDAEAGGEDSDVFGPVVGTGAQMERQPGGSSR